MANDKTTTRRALFGAAVALPAVAATAALASTGDKWAGWTVRVEDRPPPPPTPEEAGWNAWAKGMGWAHPDGERAVRNAQAAGMAVKDCHTVIMHTPNAQPGEFPALLFRTRAGFRCFRPRGEDL